MTDTEMNEVLRKVHEARNGLLRAIKEYEVALGVEQRKLDRLSGMTVVDLYLDLPVETLGLSERPKNCLRRAQVKTIGELTQWTDVDLLNLTGFGVKSLDEVTDKLDMRGLSLKTRTMGPGDWDPKDPAEWLASLGGT